MKKRRLLAFGTLLLLPYLISVDGDSSSVPGTFIEFAISKGLYADVTRDCSGNVVSVDKRNFWDAGAKVVHRVSVLKVTADAGATTGDNNDVTTNYENVPQAVQGEYSTTEQTETRVTPYASATVGLDTKYFGLDLGGALLFEKGGTRPIPAGNLRIGLEDILYLSCGVAQNTNLFGGSSLVDLGIGIGTGKPGSLLWLGIGGIPYDGTVFSAKLDYPVSDKIAIQPRIGIGLEQFGEYSVSLGMRMAL